jgi:hypothetical protein
MNHTKIRVAALIAASTATAAKNPPRTVPLATSIACCERCRLVIAPPTGTGRRVGQCKPALRYGTPTKFKLRALIVDVNVTCNRKPALTGLVDSVLSLSCKQRVRNLSAKITDCFRETTSMTTPRSVGTSRRPIFTLPPAPEIRAHQDFIPGFQDVSLGESRNEGQTSGGWSVRHVSHSCMNARSRPIVLKNSRC